MAKTKAARMAEIRAEIKWYGVQENIATVMLKLGELGLAFSGHGAGFGGEDFGLVSPDKGCTYLYVNICDTGRAVVYSANVTDNRTGEWLEDKTFKRPADLYKWIKARL